MKSFEGNPLNPPTEEHAPEGENVQEAERSEGHESLLERKKAAFEKVTNEFFEACDAIKETLHENPTVEVGGEAVPIGEDPMLYLVAEYEHMQRAAEKLKEAAEYRDDYESARAAAYLLQVAQAELHAVQSFVDMHTRYGDDAYGIMQRLRPDMAERLQEAESTVETLASREEERTE